MVYHLKVLIGHHGSALVPLVATYHMHAADAKGIGTAHDSTHIEVALEVLDGNL